MPVTSAKPPRKVATPEVADGGIRRSSGPCRRSRGGWWLRRWSSWRGFAFEEVWTLVQCLKCPRTNLCACNHSSTDELHNSRQHSFYLALSQPAQPTPRPAPERARRPGARRDVGRQALEQYAPAAGRLDRAENASTPRRGRPPGPRPGRPRTAARATGRERAGRRVERRRPRRGDRAGQVVASAGELVGALEAEQPARARRAARGGPRRAGRRACCHGSPAAGTTSSAADWRPRTSPPSRLGRVERGEQAVGERAPAASNAAAIAGQTSSRGHHVRLAAEALAGDVAGEGDAAARRCARRARPARRRARPGARAPASSAASRSASASRRRPRRPQQVERAARSAGSTIDCVATAPTPGPPTGTSEPTENQCDWTATPSSPVAGSRATIE